MRIDEPRVESANAAGEARESGMALIVVLWVVASAALLVSAFNAIARSGASFAASEVELSKTEALLDAGVEIAASQLLGGKEQRGWQPDGSRHVVAYGGADLVISVRDPNGLVDLNLADGDVLLGLLQSNGATETEAKKLRDVILAARGENVDKKDAAKAKEKADKRGFDKPGSQQGAGSSAAKMPAQPTAAATPPSGDAAATEGEGGEEKRRKIVFIDPDQLRYLPGMPLRVYKAVAPLVTVYSKDGRINVATAPDAVLASVPNLSRIDVARVRDAVRSRLPNKFALDDAKKRGGDALSDEAGPAFIVTVMLERQRFRAAREYVIAVGLDDKAPYRLVAKRTLALAN